MKHKAFISAAVSVFILASAAILMSGNGRLIGKIGSINSGKKEIIVNVGKGRMIRMGEQLYVRVGDEIVIMEATFPMQTTVKCRLQKASAGFFNSLEKDMNVYKYDRAAIEGSPDGVAEVACQIEDIGGMEMVYIEGGTFTMGSPESETNRQSDENQHEVTLSSFWIGKYEVTQKQYYDVTGKNNSYFRGDYMPVEKVSWYDTVEFCNRLSEKNKLKLYYKIDKNTKDPDNESDFDNIKWRVTINGGNGFRLPTEAEWEYACRAATETAAEQNAESNGDYCWNSSNSDDMTHPVGEKNPNNWCLYDMSGNVLEWCFDWYDPGYYNRSSANNPAGPDRGEFRVLRGGAWDNPGKNMRFACRYGYGADHFYNTAGFRVVRSAR